MARVLGAQVSMLVLRQLEQLGVDTPRHACTKYSKNQYFVHRASRLVECGTASTGISP
jgi:hypothetical protein